MKDTENSKGNIDSSNDACEKNFVQGRRANIKTRFELPTRKSIYVGAPDGKETLGFQGTRPGKTSGI